MCGSCTTAYFHNMIGLLNGNHRQPTPMRIHSIPRCSSRRAIFSPRSRRQEWHFRRSVDYSGPRNKAVLDYASRKPRAAASQHLAHGKNAIDHGNKDSWTVTADDGRGGEDAEKAPTASRSFFRDPASATPAANVIPGRPTRLPHCDQVVNALIGTGVKVHRAKEAFAIADKKYPAGSYVVQCAQAFPRARSRPVRTAGSPGTTSRSPARRPLRPMTWLGIHLRSRWGVRFDRILTSFEGPFEELKDEIPPPPAKVLDTEKAVGFFLHMRTNDAFRAREPVARCGRRGAAAEGSRSRWTGTSTQPACSSLPRKAGHAGAVGEDRGVARYAIHRLAGSAGQGSGDAQADAGRPGGPLRRVDAVGLDAVVVGTIRVPVHGGVPAGPR